MARALVDYITPREHVVLSVDGSLLPSWKEYRELAQDARKNTTSLGALAGGSNLPLVLYPTEKALDLSSFTQRPDAILS